MNRLPLAQFFSLAAAGTTGRYEPSKPPYPSSRCKSKLEGQNVFIAERPTLLRVFSRDRFQVVLGRAEKIQVRGRQANVFGMIAAAGLRDR